MQFGSVPLSSARGAILAHSVRAGERRLRKGHVLTDTDLALLDRAGFTEVAVARLDANDIGEDSAASRIARSAAGGRVRIGAAFTGRTNLFAQTSGLAVIDAARIAAVNAIDESVTIATVAPFARVEPRQMLATIKIIPFAAPAAAVEAAERIARAAPLVGIAPFVTKRVALVSTFIADEQRLLDKNVSAIKIRLTSLGSKLVFERRVPHRDASVAAAIEEALATGADPVLVFGASAITDRRDVIPAAIVQSGGVIDRFGMPVDPGNLLLLGHIGHTTVVGLPGCARSPKRNGFDFVLERLLAELPLTPEDMAAMGVGGLLSEVPTRPQPRERHVSDAPRAPMIAAVVLAAGLASRMGRNKLTATLEGRPLLRYAVEAAAHSHASGVIVVTGNDVQAVEAALDGLNVAFVHNPDFREGLSASLKAGLRAVPDDCDGAMVLLGDMPGVSTALIDKLIAAFNPEEGRAICVAAHGGKRGNPVLWAREFFADILSLEGDVGAKHLIAANEDAVCEVEAGSDGPLVDIDTPDALANYRTRI